MKVALFRAIEDLSRTSEALRRSGLEPVAAPVFETIVVAPKPPLPSCNFLIATSAKAFSAFPTAPALWRKVPIAVVGAATAAAAELRGFQRPLNVSENSAELATFLIDGGIPCPRTLYLAGRDRKPELEHALMSAGFPHATLETYRSQARAAWRADESAGIAACSVALHFSRRSAELALGLAHESRLGARFREMVHVCISGDAAEPLRAGGAAQVLVADKPTEGRMLSAIKNMKDDRT